MKRPHKYGAVRTEVDGISFASKAEARRYAQLKLLQKAGKIDRLELQPRYPISVGGHAICTYVGDFQYVEIGRDGYATSRIVEDVKGVKTDVYQIKKKLLKALYGIDITEVK